MWRQIIMLQSLRRPAYHHMIDRVIISLREDCVSFVFCISCDRDQLCDWPVCQCINSSVTVLINHCTLPRSCINTEPTTSTRKAQLRTPYCTVWTSLSAPSWTAKLLPGIKNELLQECQPFSGSCMDQFTLTATHGGRGADLEIWQHIAYDVRHSRNSLLSKLQNLSKDN